MNKIIKLVVSAVAFTVISTGSAFALDSLSARLESPKSPTFLRDYTITFVALDIQNRPVTVRCYKKAPGEAGFAIFDSDKNFSAAAGTGYCNVTSSLVSAEGNYDFYVRASADGDSVQSNTVSVEYKIGDGPGTPTNYSKERPSNCSYKIKFHTADDSGKTVKVDIYRSDQTSFDANDSTRVGSVSIGSNSDGEFSQDVPECGKDYYYVIRAFNNAGVGSDLVGDSIQTVIAPTGTAQGVQGAIPLPTSQVTGEAITEEAEEEVTEGEVGRVLGEEVTPGKPTGGLLNTMLAKKWPIVLGILLIVAGIVVLLRKPKQE